MASTASFLDATFTTPFNNRDTSIKNYLIGQTVFSTAIGFFVCRLPLFQSAALGLAVEGCRYATDKAITQLSSKFAFIRDHRTAVKTALVAGSFFIAKAVVNILPGSSNLLTAGLLMTATYLVAEPIAKRVSEACTSEKTVKQCFYLDVPKKNDDGFFVLDVNNVPVMGKENLVGDIRTQYPTATQKIATMWTSLFGPSGNRLGSNDA